MAQLRQNYDQFEHENTIILVIGPENAEKFAKYWTFLKEYMAKGILPDDPFQTLDQTGVGQLVEIGVQKGRSVKPDLKVGICGEHGGDPRSVVFCHKVGMNYVSCSPYRVPIARLAAAQAQLSDPR